MSTSKSYTRSRIDSAAFLPQPDRGKGSSRASTGPRRSDSASREPQSRRLHGPQHSGAATTQQPQARTGSEPSGVVGVFAGAVEENLEEVGAASILDHRRRIRDAARSKASMMPNPHTRSAGTRGGRRARTASIILYRASVAVPHGSGDEAFADFDLQTDIRLSRFRA